MKKSYVITGVLLALTFVAGYGVSLYGWGKSGIRNNNGMQSGIMQGASIQGGRGGRGQGNTGSPGNQGPMQPPVVTEPQNPTPLSDAQKQELLYIIEEEKLARDVYMTLYTTWNIKKFYNILNAEENHQAMVATLLQKYGLSNPTDGKDLGEFINPDLQKLYTTLVDQGKKSSTEAIQVGITIEQTDITDLQDMIPLFSGYSDITTTLEALLAGSQRHLAAFQK